MRELQEILQVVRHLQQRAALATVIRVEGSAYRQPGAKMLIAPDDRTYGMISGGCLENDVVEHARQVMQLGQPRIVTYDTTTDEDLLWGFGLGCQGIIEIFIESLEPQNDYFPLNLLANRQETVLVTVTQVEGSVNVKLGDRLILQSQEVVVNDIDESALSHQILWQVQEIERPTTRRYACPSGSVEVFLEAIPPPLSLVIFGAGGDALPLVQFAKMLGWKVTIVDCRANEASEGRFTQADAVILTRREQVSQQVKLEPGMVAIVMTHNYFDDRAILQWLLPTSIRYLGLLGSRKRSEQLLEELQLTPEQRQKLHTPIGLDIGSNTPETIALAVVAEIQAVLHQRSGGFLKDR
jgi:xanthine/CO dehydrogenase XdhC/CoxF family maturation factor